MLQRPRPIAENKGFRGLVLGRNAVTIYVPCTYIIILPYCTPISFYMSFASLFKFVVHAVLYESISFSCAHHYGPLIDRSSEAMRPQYPRRRVVDADFREHSPSIRERQSPLRVKVLRLLSYIPLRPPFFRQPQQAARRGLCAAASRYYYPLTIVPDSSCLSRRVPPFRRPAPLCFLRSGFWLPSCGSGEASPRLFQLDS